MQYLSVSDKEKTRRSIYAQPSWTIQCICSQSSHISSHSATAYLPDVYSRIFVKHLHSIVGVVCNIQQSSFLVYVWYYWLIHLTRTRPEATSNCSEELSSFYIKYLNSMIVIISNKEASSRSIYAHSYDSDKSCET